MSINTKHRSTQTEIMDDFALEGENLWDALNKISTINQLLGGNLLTLRGIRKLISDIPTSTEINIVDVGCGNGDMLRILADYAENHNLNFQLLGIDANEFTIHLAQKLSSHYPNIIYRSEDVLSDSFKNLNYDIVLCTLTLHHFTDAEIIKIINVFNSRSRIGIVINDLQRSIIAYRLFQLLSFTFKLKAMPSHDGLTSILRGFKKEELISFSKKLNLKNYTIHWKWAFRYQWIIYKV